VIFRTRVWRCLTFFPLLSQLIYRNAYPRTRYIRWWFVRNCAIEVLGCIVYLYIIFVNFCVRSPRTLRAHGGQRQKLDRVDECSLRSAFMSDLCPFVLPCMSCLRCPSSKRSVFNSFVRMRPCHSQQTELQRAHTYCSDLPFCLHCLQTAAHPGDLQALVVSLFNVSI